MPGVTLHCVRHAQGHHNLSEENEENMHDPDLTPRGKEQCRRLCEEFPHHDKIDCIVSSPLRRTIQTAHIGFEPAIKKNKLQIILAPRAQETSDKKSDTGSDMKKLKEEFGDLLDDHRMESGWNQNEGKWEMDTYAIEDHAIELRREIHHKAEERGFKHVVLVAHGGWMHFFTEDWSDNPGEENQTGWENTEFRSYQFVEGKGSHLKETKESKERRKNRAAGGYRKEDGEANENPDLKNGSS